MVGFVQSGSGMDRGLEWMSSTARMNVVARDLIDLYTFYTAVPKVDTTHIEELDLSGKACSEHGLVL